MDTRSKLDAFLPPIEEFAEDGLEKGDPTWLEKENYMSIREIKQI